MRSYLLLALMCFLSLIGGVCATPWTNKLLDVSARSAELQVRLDCTPPCMFRLASINESFSRVSEQTRSGFHKFDLERGVYFYQYQNLTVVMFRVFDNDAISRNNYYLAGLLVLVVLGSVAFEKTRQYLNP
jgi:hypothetical protein